MEFLVMLLAGFHWKIHLKFQIAGHEISGNASDWISLEKLLLAQFGHGISGNATGWISLEKQSHACMWNL
jgi:hypothetical protein